MRESLVRDRTKAINQIHGFLLEVGVNLPVGQEAITHLPAILAGHSLQPWLVSTLERLHEHCKYLCGQISELDKEIKQQLADDDLGQRLMRVPKEGLITASVLAVEMGDSKQHGCSRDFTASVGLVPCQYSTGGRSTLLETSKRGDKNIQRLPVQCARTQTRQLERQSESLADWVRSMLTRRHANVVACALANKLACTVWALATHPTTFQAGGGPTGA